MVSSHSEILCSNTNNRTQMNHNAEQKNTMKIKHYVFLFMGFPSGSEVKASACNAGDVGLIPG